MIDSVAQDIFTAVTPILYLYGIDRMRNEKTLFLVQEDDGEWPMQAEVVAGVRSRLDLPFHGGGLDPSGNPRAFLSCESTANTFR